MSNFDLKGESADVFISEAYRVPKTVERIRLSTGPRINLTFPTIYSADDPLLDIT